MKPRKQLETLGDKIMKIRTLNVIILFVTKGTIEIRQKYIEMITATEASFSRKLFHCERVSVYNVIKLHFPSFSKNDVPPELKRGD